MMLSSQFLGSRTTVHIAAASEDNTLITNVPLLCLFLIFLLLGMTSYGMEYPLVSLNQLSQTDTTTRPPVQPLLKSSCSPLLCWPLVVLARWKDSLNAMQQ